MAKRIVIAVLALVAVGALAVLILRPEAERRVVDLVERYGEAATGTEVDVRGVSIVLSEGRGTIDRLTVRNPEGFETDYAVRVEQVDVVLDVGSVAAEVPIVTELLVDGVDINAEQRRDTTNLTEIQARMTASEDEPEAGADEGRLIVRLFRATNARLTITSELLARAETLDLDDVVVRDIGGAQGVPYSEAAAAMLGPVIDAAVAAVRARLRDAAEEAARGAAEEEAQEIEQEAEERLQELLEQ